MCRIKRGGLLQGVAHFPGGQLNQGDRLNYITKLSLGKTR
jgi:hypothetical protein